jgi:hypothetical protein
VTIYENPNLIPRIFFVDLSQSNPDYGELVRNKNYSILEFLKSHKKEDTLNTGIGLSLKPFSEEPKFNYNIKLIKYLDKEICLDLKNDSSGFLVVSDTFYPGWKAFVDGKEEKIFRANNTMRAVFVKEGVHKVRFLYDPLSVKLGFSFSLISFTVILFLCLSRVGERKINIK